MRRPMNEEYMRDWNMNQAWLQEIMELWREAHQYRQRAAENASLESWWDAMRSIWAMLKWDIEILIEKDVVYKAKKEELESSFKKANEMFMASKMRVQGALPAAVKTLDEIEFQIKFLIGAMGYYKFKVEKRDPRYAQ